MEECTWVSTLSRKFTSLLDNGNVVSQELVTLKLRIFTATILHQSGNREALLRHVLSRHHSADRFTSPAKSYLAAKNFAANTFYLPPKYLGVQRWDTFACGILETEMVVCSLDELLSDRTLSYINLSKSSKPHSKSPATQWRYLQSHETLENFDPALVSSKILKRPSTVPRIRLPGEDWACRLYSETMGVWDGGKSARRDGHGGKKWSILPFLSQFQGNFDGVIFDGLHPVYL